MFQDPKHRYVVAEDATGTIVGFIAWTIPTAKGGIGEVEDEYPEWEPNTPEGTNLEFIGAYVVARAEQKRKYYTEDMYGKLEPWVGSWRLKTNITSSQTEVEALSVDPKYQRQGIGALLLSHLISSEVEKKPAAVYISSSHEGKGLYERFGWTVLGKHVTDLSHAGIEKPIDLFDMMRKWSGNRAQQM